MKGGVWPVTQQHENTRWHQNQSAKMNNADKYFIYLHHE